MNMKSWGVGTVSVLVAVFVFLIIFSPISMVSAGHRGVVTRFGAVQDKVLVEGLHLINPLDGVTMFDVRIQKYESVASAASKDLQSVQASIALNFHPQVESVQKLYQEVGVSYADAIIAPAIQESLKATTAKYTAEELITKREEVSDAMVASLRERLTPRYIAVDEVAITNFTFSPAFEAAIEQKVTAEQEALASKNRLEQTKYEAEQRIVAAKAEAESIKLQAEALQANQDLVQFEAVKKWNGVLPSTFAGGELPFLLTR